MDSKLIKSAELLELLDKANDGFMISDKNGKILYFNKAYEIMTAFGENVLKVGSYLKDYLNKGHFKKSSCLLAIKEKNTMKLIHNYPNKKISMIVVSKPIFDTTNNIKYVITNSREISEYIELKDDINNIEESINSFNERIKDNKNILKDNNFVYASDKMHKIFKTAKDISKFDVNVLIQGESGVGKEIVAKFIHEKSNREKSKFIELNCGAIPENLLETELFGYEKGSFTGAIKEGKDGLLKYAEGGTLLLDEIGDMPLNLQVKILGVLENKKYYPVGGLKEIKTDIRIIAATNKNLEKLVEKGLFREDLYYRLNIIKIEIPPLRERVEDIAPLCFYFLEKFNNKYGLNKRINPTTLKTLKYNEWKGNVRELKNTIQKMVILSESENSEYLKDTLLKNITLNNIDFSEIDISDFTLKEFVENSEKNFLIKARKKYMTTRNMAKELGVHHTTIIRKLNKYEINESCNKENIYR